MIALLRAVAGLIGWAAAFSMLYAVQGFSCARGWGDEPLLGISAARLLLILVYMAWVGALGWLCWYFRPHTNRTDLLASLALINAVIGLVSTVYTGMPVLATTTCV
ncbi:hypothetical protein [Sphingomonas sp. M1-B02]|uniref:hypothetical protein n=1 Tax=Sphingomonas sp. M1-B02 TaxID=3114300 RepID=UPI00223FE98B|nr:hypothetical protein [Sphingomonas sp. S6-11]UZK67055.1 hypothetical protein OKW87_04285 [Sphingomonas sp. S6-11]